MKTVIYHNPKCSTCRKALNLLAERNVEVEIVEYLKTPPSQRELEDILTKLGLEPRELMRNKEKLYQEKGLDNPDLDDATLIRAMVENPILIQRPIVLFGDKAALGRPVERIVDIL
ncbi:MAG: arsenate reductase [Candidatus Kentron sp. G]|nr:MAG: arsenate reductase [Candidatus Kentron sp. G]VFN08103.1 MAG: arsenate reductase [Candidatus Kentron sp. G]